MGNNRFKSIIFWGLILFLLYSMTNNIRLLLRARESLTQARITLEKETARNRDLTNRLTEVGKQSYIEKVARDSLSLAKENELVLVLPPESELKKLSPRLFEDNGSKVTSTSDQTPNWKRWLQVFL